MILIVGVEIIVYLCGKNKNMRNRFNRLTSKEWLPFQKSWFRFNSLEVLYNENIRFFCKAENEGDTIFYYGNHFDKIKKIAYENKEPITNVIEKNDKPFQFVIIDLIDKIKDNASIEEYEKLKKEIISLVVQLYEIVLERRFITIFIKNIEINGSYYPIAWDLAKHISTIFSLKDEKIGCLENIETTENKKDFFSTDKSTFYTLYFRKDENSEGAYKNKNFDFFKSNKAIANRDYFDKPMKSWFILKPLPRKKNEILHPAKYPEELVDIFVNIFTKAGDNVFDPMSGTGSTQLGALRNKRNGYGTELSEFFSKIANDRCREYINPTQMALFSDVKNEVYKILNIDARQINNEIFPKIDYVLTSPPYWDMLNMKGAENQASRKEKGLQTNYSDSDKDLGNISEYEIFIDELITVYDKVIDLVKPGGYLTIVVKNIKKQGRNYPFAWDLSEKLQNKLILLPETFWCQDDISIAPYGYGNTWVSNTFHQYCLNFQKPL
jgi:DNA modification methylase